MTDAFSFDVLPDGSLVLAVGEFCIETAARRAHREVTEALLAGRGEDAALGILAETLERFLTTTRFSALRTEHPELAGGTRCRVRLHREGDGGVRWELVGMR